MIPYVKQNISEDDMEMIVEVVKSALINQAEIVPKFANLISDYVNLKYSLATNRSSSAFQITCLT